MHTALRTLLVLLFIFFAPVAFAQKMEGGISPKIDSFFDVFSNVELPDPKCDRCKVLEQEILDLELQISALELSLIGEESGIEMADDSIPGLEGVIEDLGKQIEEMKNPKNFVESDGRRYDSSDKVALERRNANLWKAYKGGRMTAEEYMEEIGKPFDDPEVAEAIAMLKEIILQELNDRLSDIQESLDKVKEMREKAVEKVEALKGELAALRETLAKLMEQLKDCLDRCAEEDVNIPEEYGIGQLERGFFDGLLDLFGDLFGEDETADDPLAELDDFLDGLGRDEPGRNDAGGGVPIEMIPLDLRSTSPEKVDSFFDVFFDIPLPPVVCHLCDPIRSQLDETTQSLNDLLQQQVEAQAEVDAAYRDLATAQNARDEAERALDELNNPRSSAESDGRKFDSTDQAAMRVRNARLWSAYKSGNLSAQELSDEWGKPFDDPEVQEELNGIKQRMKDELEEAKKSAQEAIDRINESIAALNDQLVDLAGRIAAHNVILEYLLKELEECEKLCKEKKDEPVSGLVPLFEGKLFLDGFESGDPKQWTDDDGGSTESMDEEDSSGDEEDEEPKKGFMDWLKFGGDDVSEDEDKEKKEDKGLFCGWFGFFCKDDAGKYGAVQTDLTLEDAVNCMQNAGTPTACDPFDINGDGVADIADIDQLPLSLIGPNGLNIPLSINGMDGNDTLAPSDLDAFGDCLNGGPCPGLGFNPPPGFGSLPPDQLIGLDGGDFGLQLNGPGGNDILLGDPVPDPFVGMDGISGFDPNSPLPPIPDGFFGPGSDPFGGGVTLFGPGGEVITPPPPPPPPAQSEQQIIERLVRDTLSRLPRLKECEKYVVTVIRQRIGNTTRYTVRVTKTKDEKCTCPAGQFYGIDACYAGCQGGKEEGLCTVVLGNCYECREAPATEGECQTDTDCDDHDECTSDSCDQNGQCTNTKIEDCGDDFVEEECPELSYGGGKEGENACKEVCQGKCTQIAVGPTERLCWMCSDASVELRTCETIGFFTKREDCQRTCDGSCIGGEKEKRNCYECVSKKPSEQCDAPMMEVKVCEESCEEPDKGKCEKSYTRKDGVSCYSCKTTTQATEQCPSGSSTNCSNTCDGTCESVKILNNGTKCQKCIPPTTTGTFCPSGHVKSAGDCPSGTTAIADDEGCFECSVISCPSGTYKNECPSSCANGCDTTAEQHGVTCFKCKQSCEEACSKAGYARVGKDWSDHIQGVLNGYTCVSGANISLQTSTIGSCTCSNEPSVSVDQTVPVCRGTPCGDVACGQSTSCSVGDNTTATVSCNWGGWKKIDMNKFQPVIGQ